MVETKCLKQCCTFVLRSTHSSQERVGLLRFCFFFCGSSCMPLLSSGGDEVPAALLLAPAAPAMAAPSADPVFWSRASRSSAALAAGPFGFSFAADAASRDMALFTSSHALAGGWGDCILLPSASLRLSIGIALRGYGPRTAKPHMRWAGRARAAVFEKGVWDDPGIIKALDPLTWISLYLPAASPVKGTCRGIKHKPTKRGNGPRRGSFFTREYGFECGQEERPRLARLLLSLHKLPNKRALSSRCDSPRG
jgi:hypothetical protein